MSALEKVVFEGDGIAAVCAARLLADAGIPCAYRTGTRPRLAAILLGTQTQYLLRQIFTPEPSSLKHSKDLFAGFTPITQRIVLWGDAKEPVTLPHAGVVAPEDELLDRLWRRVSSVKPFNGDIAEASWTIASSRAAAAEEWHYGSRHARFANVQLTPLAEVSACWIESLPSGWLFLLSRGSQEASLISVDGPVNELLAASKLIQPRVATILNESAPIPSYPRLSRTLVTGNTIACGSAAMSFDPLCGEGAGNAAREAFLAVAVVRAALAGGSTEALAEHYKSRLLQGFHRHLQHCLEFYSTGGTTAFWQNEREALDQGLTQLTDSTQSIPPAQYRLVDRDLLPLAPTTC